VSRIAQCLGHSCHFLAARLVGAEPEHTELVAFSAEASSFRSAVFAGEACVGQDRARATSVRLDNRREFFMIRRAVAGVVLAAGLALGTVAVASADPPGPGDKQCVPGGHGNPDPGFKAGACRNP
jgi:hypothetical protein